MKKFKQFIKTCCLFISAVSLVLFSTAAKAQLPPLPPCCVDAGPDITVAQCGSATLGVSNATCTTLSGCSTDLCPNDYTWSPTTDLNCGGCAQPVFNGCLEHTSGSRDYTLSITCNTNGTRIYTDVVHVTWTACCSGCCRIGQFIPNEQTTPEANGIKIFPNPSSGKVIVQFDVISSNTNIEVYDVSGKLVMTKANLPELNKTIELNLSQAKGYYFIKIFNDEKTVLNKKILIQ